MTDHIDTCIVCGKEIPPGPDCCSTECDAILARVMAAAPDMLNALELAEATIMRLDRHAPGAQQGTLDVIRAAIRKARGAQ